MHITLAQLYSELQPPNAEPLAVEALAGALEVYCEGVEVDIKIVNPLLDPNAVSKLIASVSESQCRLLGLSVPQGTYFVARQILNIVESTFIPGERPLVVLGHALPTYMPNMFLEQYPWAFVIRGWGENSLVALVKALLADEEIYVEGIPSLIYVEHGQIRSNPVALDIVPQVPKRFEPGKFFARVETSRGCHYGRCTFCTRPPGKKDYWSRILIDTIRSSILNLTNEGVQYFTFSDEDFIGNDLLGAKEIAKLVAEIGHVNFSMSVRADNIINPNGSSQENEERLDIMMSLKQAGLSLVFIGVESLSNSQLKRYGKGIRVEDSVRAVDIVNSLDLPIEIGFIMFDPFVTLDELREIAANLRISGMWENVGSLFSKMLIQKDTSYEQWLNMKGLLKEFDVNLMSHGWEFQNERVAHVAKICLDWSDIFHPVYRLLRNLDRTKRNYKIAKEFMRKFRNIDLEVLDHVLEQASDDSIRLPSIREYYYEHRINHSRSLHHLLRTHATSDEEYLLLNELSEFLSNHH